MIEPAVVAVVLESDRAQVAEFVVAVGTDLADKADNRYRFIRGLF